MSKKNVFTKFVIFSVFIVIIIFIGFYFFNNFNVKTEIVINHLSTKPFKLTTEQIDNIIDKEKLGLLKVIEYQKSYFMFIFTLYSIFLTIIGIATIFKIFHDKDEITQLQEITKDLKSKFTNKVDEQKELNEILKQKFDKKMLVLDADIKKIHAYWVFEKYIDDYEAVLKLPTNLQRKKAIQMVIDNFEKTTTNMITALYIDLLKLDNVKIIYEYAYRFRSINVCYISLLIKNRNYEGIKTTDEELLKVDKECNDLYVKIIKKFINPDVAKKFKEEIFSDDYSMFPFYSDR